MKINLHMNYLNYKLNKKNNRKSEHGITLISLAITIFILIILATIGISAGVEALKFSQFTQFSAELKLMQTKVNELYENLNDGKSITTNDGATYEVVEEGKEKTYNIGESIDKEPYKTQADKVFTEKESEITNSDGYRYFSKELSKKLDVEVEQDFFINIQKRSVVSAKGFKYHEKWYYTLEQLPDSVYNVIYKENEGTPIFNASYTQIEENKWKITVKDIKYNGGYINKWYVMYKLEEENDWHTSEDLNFIVTKYGNYKIKVKNGNIESVEKDLYIPKPLKVGNNKIYKDSDGDIAVIPVGFSIVPGLDDVSEGLVISDVENDTGNTGNQFVWIPVANINNYKTNTTYTDTNVSTNTQNDIGYLPLSDAEIGINSQTSDEQKRQLTLEKEKEMVDGAGGFYISRYEAGKENADTLVSKKEANVWVSIAQETVKNKAKTFINNANVKSALCTGIQWDMIMAFIGDGRLDGTSQPYNVKTSSPNRHKGSLAISGQNLADKVCNIYDLEGNCFEYVAERNTYSTSDSYVLRGCEWNVRPEGASYRRTFDGTAGGATSFRFVLYVMN